MYIHRGMIGYRQKFFGLRSLLYFETVLLAKVLFGVINTYFPVLMKVSVIVNTYFDTYFKGRYTYFNTYIWGRNT